jgi:hypothetical protein
LSPLPLSMNPKDYPVWDDLDLDILPSGRVSRLWVVLAEDAMSTPIRVPVIVAKGVRPGPVVGLVSCPLLYHPIPSIFYTLLFYCLSDFPVH